MSQIDGTVRGFKGSAPSAVISTAFDQQRQVVQPYIALPDAANATFVPRPNAVYRSAMGAGRNFTMTTATCEALKLASGEAVTFRIIETTANVITFVTGGAGQVATGTGTLATVNGQTATFVLANQGGTLTLSRMGSVAH